MTIAFRPKRDAILGVTAWVIPLLTNFAVMPVIVRGLGPTEYGLYTLLASFGAYAVALAVGNALVRFAPVVADIPLAGCRVLLPTALGLAAASAATNSVVVVLLWRWLLPGVAVTPGLIVTCALISILILNQVLIVVPQIARHLPLVAIATVVSGVLMPIGAAIVASRGGGWVGVLSWQLAVAAGLFLVLAAVAALLLMPNRGPRQLDWQWRMKLTALAASIGLSQMLGNALAVSERGLLGLLGGSAAVGYYVLALMIALLLRTAIAQATLMLPVIVTQTYGDNANHRLAQLYGWLMRHALAIMTFSAVALVISGPALLSVWLKDGYRAEMGAVLRWLAPAIALLAIDAIPWNFAEARGNATANILLAGFWLVGGLAAASLLIPSLGAEGLAIARLATMLAVPVHIAWIERKVFGSIQTRLWVGSLWRLSIAALVSAGVMQTGLTIFPNGWIGLGADVIISFIVFYMLMFATGQITLDDLTVPIAPLGRSAAP